jgi:SPOR domain
MIGELRLAATDLRKSMVRDLKKAKAAEPLRAPAVTVPPRPQAVTTPVSMQGLWRVVVWGSTAATALLIAVLASRGITGSQRAAVAAATLVPNTVPVVHYGKPEPPAFDAAAETKRLSDAVAVLAADNDALKARLATVEQNMDDVTGSIAKQIEAVKTPPWPDDDAAVPATPAAIAAVVAPALPLPMEYGVDIGSATSIEALRARWAGIRTAHPHLFGTLAPSVSLREIHSRPELRLILGPLASIDAATHLCAELASVHVPCEPTIFAGQHLALE